jgi:hypothetical protein
MTALAAAAEDGAMNQAQPAFTNSGVQSHSVLAQGNVRKVAQRKRSLPLRIGRALIGLLGVVVVLGLSGAVYESIAEAADARAYPPPGQMIDVGGYRLHINCIGTGSPTVVIEAGWGDSSGGVEQLGATLRREHDARLHLRSCGNGLQRARTVAADRRPFRSRTACVAEWCR